MQAKGYGAPELVTSGRDGCVRVWDVRQPDAPVAAFEPADPANIRLVTSVAGYGRGYWEGWLRACVGCAAARCARRRL